MSGTVSILQQFANGLKSRSEETRAKAAKDLQHYVTMELREVSAANKIIYLCLSFESRALAGYFGDGGFGNTEAGLREEMGHSRELIFALACRKGERVGDTDGSSSTRINKLDMSRALKEDTGLYL